MKQISIFKIFSLSLNYILKDKIILLLSIIPILIGIIFYFTLGSYFYTDLYNLVNTTINNYIDIKSLGTILHYIVFALISIMLFFIVNWTFIIVISIISSPFNDLLSKRVEKKFLQEHNLKQPNLNIKFNMLNFLKNSISIIFTEIKKMSLILLINISSMILSWIPFLFPISILLSAITLAIGFIDYSWSRDELTLKQCKNNFKKKFLTNILSGLIMFIFITIPIINVLFIPFGIIYFTLIYNFTKEKKC